MAETTRIELPADATVADLVAALQKMPQDASIWATDGGHSWGVGQVESAPWGPHGATIVEVS